MQHARRTHHRHRAQRQQPTQSTRQVRNQKETETEETETGTHARHVQHTDTKICPRDPARGGWEITRKGARRGAQNAHAPRSSPNSSSKCNSSLPRPTKQNVDADAKPARSILGPRSRIFLHARALAAPRIHARATLIHRAAAHASTRPALLTSTRPLPQPHA